MFQDNLPGGVNLQLPTLPCKILILNFDDNGTTVIDKWDLYSHSGSQKMKPKRNFFGPCSLFLVRAVTQNLCSLSIIL